MIYTYVYIYKIILEANYMENRIWLLYFKLNTIVNLFMNGKISKAFGVWNKFFDLFIYIVFIQQQKNYK